MQARSLALILAALMTIGSLAGCIEPEIEDHTHEEGDHAHDENENPIDDGTADGDEGEDSPEGNTEDEHIDEGETEDENHGEHETEPESAPWFCNSSGMGGHHMDPAYTDMMKGQLSDDDCAIVSIQFAAAAEWASQWPTIADAEADGWHMAVGYVAGMGTHHVRLNDYWMEDDVDFDPEDPEFPGTRLDGIFEYDKPEFLMYSGTDPDSELVGFAWYVKTDSTTPPSGFAGDNDWWHRHLSLCFTNDSFLVVGEELEDETCDSANGTNVHLQDYWMSHAWIYGSWLQQHDVFANHHPCLPEDGPLTDENDMCWMDAMHGADHEMDDEEGSDDENQHS